MHPVLIKIGSLEIHTYGFLLAIGFLLGIWILSYNAKKFGLSSKKMVDFVFYVLIISLVGAKLFLFLSEFQFYITNPKEILNLLRAGGHFYGGLIFGILFSVWHLRKNNLPVLKTGDIVVPSLALGHAFGRLGCLSAGCCYGRPSNLFLSIIFSDPLASQNTGVPLGIPLYPTQLIEAIFNFLNFGFLFFLLKKRKYDGQVFFFYIINYSVARFVLEYFRGDPDRGYLITGTSAFTSFSIPQFISSIGIIASLLFFFYFRKK
ncbi:MAG: prolipoprotein diacylglyceryl transferase [Acidobacteriota bacterium]